MAWDKTPVNTNARRTHLHISRQGEVLSEGVTLEPVVCQNTSQVGVVGEEHAIHVPNLEAHKHASHTIHESLLLWESLMKMTQIYRAV